MKKQIDASKFQPNAAVTVRSNNETTINQEVLPDELQKRKGRSSP